MISHVHGTKHELSLVNTYITILEPNAIKADGDHMADGLEDRWKERFLRKNLGRICFSILFLRKSIVFLHYHLMKLKKNIHRGWNPTKSPNHKISKWLQLMLILTAQLSPDQPSEPRRRSEFFHIFSKRWNPTLQLMLMGQVSPNQI